MFQKNRIPIAVDVAIRKAFVVDCTNGETFRLERFDIFGDKLGIFDDDASTNTTDTIWIVHMLYNISLRSMESSEKSMFQLTGMAEDILNLGKLHACYCPGDFARAVTLA